MPSNYTDDPDWKGRGRCAEVDPDLWFPAAHQSAKPAQAICGGCEVQTICRDYARRNGEDGIWGGETRWQREAFWGWRQAPEEN